MCNVTGRSSRLPTSRAKLQAKHRVKQQAKLQARPQAKAMSEASGESKVAKRQQGKVEQTLPCLRYG
jgi:hypothetical protein